MRIRWRGLELPARVDRDDSVSTPSYGKFTAEPFERGFGTTVGNSLRRILLSSLEGASVTAIKIKGADHEFSSLPGVVEDVTDIILNLKGLVVRLDTDEPQTLTLSTDKAGEVTGGMINPANDVTILNPDHVLATLTEDVPFEMTLHVAKGRGYHPATENQPKGDEVEWGTIAVDSLYSPVTRVRYATEDARVGHRTDYDRLIIEIWTNGTISPEMALVEAAKILRKHLNPFVQFFELGTELASEHAVGNLIEAAKPNIDPDLEQKLNMTVQELDLSVRANNCLESAKVSTVRELVQRTEQDLLKVRSFGKTSLREVKRRLADMGLSLGMDLEAVKNAGQAAAAAAAAAALDDDDDYDDEDEDEIEDVEETETSPESTGEASEEAASQ
ncbi:MAG: DNA-directed RNA polymerase subunit alpha [Phycisphaerae bacterium]